MKTLISLLLYLICASAWSQCSPIVIDTRRDGIELGPAGRGVSFDVNADGFPDLVQWVRPGGDEAFLTLDRNRNGIVDDGSELFGVGTPLLAGGTAPNGFVALAQYDQPLLGGNDDGLISRADAIWQELAMWVDSNADGIATLGEMRRPESFGLTSFATIPKVRRYTDPAGNSLGERWSSRASTDGRRLLPAPRSGRSDPDAGWPLSRKRTRRHRPGTGNRWHSDRTAARSCSSFVAVACDCIASIIH
jgi:hypothetical protein